MASFATFYSKLLVICLITHFEAYVWRTFGEMLHWSSYRSRSLCIRCARFVYAMSVLHEHSFVCGRNERNYSKLLKWIFEMGMTTNHVKTIQHHIKESLLLMLILLLLLFVFVYYFFSSYLCWRSIKDAFKRSLTFKTISLTLVCSR